jgi:hypothetical protein
MNVGLALVEYVRGLSDIVLILSSFVGILALLDLLLSEQQKQMIQDQTIRFWAWLDELKKLRFADWFRNRPARILLGLMAGAIVFTCVNPILLLPVLIMFSFATGEAGVFILVPLFIILLILMVLFWLWLGSRIIATLLRPSNKYRVIGRAVIIGVLLLSMPIVSYLTFERLPENWGSSLFVYIPLLVTLLFVGFGGVFLLVYWAAAVIPLLFAYTATVLLYTLELVVRRIAEYPKGPILGISAGCAGVAAALKFFG